MVLLGVKITQVCPHCGFVFKPDTNKIESDWNIELKDIVRQVDCPRCEQVIILGKFFEETKKTKYYERFRTIFTDESMLSTDFMKHGITLYKKKAVLKDIGFVNEYKYGKGCWKLHEEYKKTKKPVVFQKKRNALKTHRWCVETTIWDADKVEVVVK